MTPGLQESTVTLTIDLPRVMRRKGSVAHVLINGERIAFLHTSRGDDGRLFLHGATACHRLDQPMSVPYWRWQQSFRMAPPDVPTCKRCMLALEKLVGAR